MIFPSSADQERGSSLVGHFRLRVSQMMLPGVSWSPNHLNDGLRLEDLLARRLSRQHLELAGWFLFMWALHRAAWESFQHGSWLHSEKMIQKARADTATHFMTLSWEPHTLLSTIFYWSHKPALILYGKGPHRAWIPEVGPRGHCRGWLLWKLTHWRSFLRWPGPFFSLCHFLPLCVSLLFTLALLLLLYLFLRHL